MLEAETLASVSVVVSTYTTERLHDVVRCISSLKEQTFPPVEIILVLDPCERLVEFYKSHVPPDVRVITSDNAGLSHARNAGVKDARGEIVAFIDDDATADKKWLESLIRNYKDPKVMGVGGLIKAAWEGKRPSWFPEELDWIVGCSYKGLPNKRSTIRNPIGCNMSFRKTVFEKVGYFRSDIGRLGKKLLASEETEFSIRVLRKIPYSKIIYEPSALVYHRVNRSRESLKHVWRRSFYEGVSKALISFKSDPQMTLSTEDLYLKYLLEVAIPSRLRRIYRFENICQLASLLFSMFAVFAGFLSGKLGRRG